VPYIAPAPVRAEVPEGLDARPVFGPLIPFFVAPPGGPGVSFVPPLRVQVFEGPEPAPRSGFMPVVPPAPTPAPGPARPALGFAVSAAAFAEEEAPAPRSLFLPVVQGPITVAPAGAVVMFTVAPIFAEEEHGDFAAFLPVVRLPILWADYRAPLYLDEAKWEPAPTVEFEAVLKLDSGVGPVFARMVRTSDGYSPDASVVQTTSASFLRVRGPAFALATGEWKAQKGKAQGSQGTIGSARAVFRQG
jgi:hypothetical protein